VLGPDANVDAPLNNTTPISLFADGDNVQLLLYRDGAGPWQAPTPGSEPGMYTINVTTDYQVVLVCATGTSAGSDFDAEELNATLGENSMPFMFCGTGSTSTAGTVKVSGTMTQPGSVWMYGNASSKTGPWSYSLDVPPRTHDLFAIGDGRIQIQRGLSITAATTEPNLDVDANGTALTQVLLTISGLAGDDAVSTETSLFTANDFALLDATGTTAETVPSGLLQQNDFQLLDVSAVGPTTSRRASTPFSGTETSFSLLPRLTGITISSGSASWSSLPDPSYTSIDLFLNGTGTSITEQHVSASAGWLASKSASSVSFDTSAPGYAASWKVDLSTAYVADFGLTDESGAIFYGTDVFETVPGGTIAPRTHGQSVARPWGPAVSSSLWERAQRLRRLRAITAHQ
jgi:hypothetical protein